MKKETTRRLISGGLNIFFSLLAFYMFSIIASLYDFSTEAVYICTLMVFLQQCTHDDLRELKKQVEKEKTQKLDIKEDNPQ